MRKYQIFTDATADMCEEMFQGLPHIEVIPMEVIIDDKSYQYGPGGNLTVDEFYAMQRAGKFLRKDFYFFCFCSQTSACIRISYWAY